VSLRIRPTTLKRANEFVQSFHRHHPRARGCVFVSSVVDALDITHGVLIAGRPVARLLDDGLTLEVNRVCTDGARNACSMLYGVAARVAFQLGYERVITYTLPNEGGASLRASGWKCVGSAGGGSWNRKKRARKDQHPTEPKWLWERRP
jgi:hypothetical protein